MKKFSVSRQKGVKKISRIAFLTVFLVLFYSFYIKSEPQFNQAVYELQYSSKITDIQEGTADVKVWIPLPRDTSHQKISGLQIQSPLPYRITEDNKYGNKMIYIETDKPPQSIDITYSCIVRRIENTSATGRDQDKRMLRFGLESNQLVPLSGEIQLLSEKILGIRKSQLTDTKSVYDHVLQHMTYDKSGEGWGKGDFQYACDVGSGNCTDFHSYFIGLLRNAGIPAYFEIGFPIPERNRQGDIPGYHCWAYFWDDGGWLPVDISEAAKNPQKTEYYFGNIDENRIALTKGRDIVLNPAQKSRPLNYFIYPYAEIDGKRHRSISKHFLFKRLTP